MARKTPKPNAALRVSLFKDVMAFSKKHKLPMSSVKDVRTFLGICEELKGNATWPAFRKVTKLVIEKFGYRPACTLKMWLKMLDACLEVELGCAYSAEVKRLDREFRKNTKSLPPLGKPSPPLPFKLENAKLIIDGDLTFDMTSAKKGGKK